MKIIEAKYGTKDRNINIINFIELDLNNKVVLNNYLNNLFKKNINSKKTKHIFLKINDDNGQVFYLTILEKNGKIYDSSELDIGQRINTLKDNFIHTDNNFREIFSENDIELFVQKTTQTQLVLNDKKIALIYVYYNRPDEQKNETNLIFFIKYGLDKNLWRNTNLEVLFIINNFVCEIDIPRYSNINVLYNNNSYDVETYNLGIKFFEDKYKCPLHIKFNYLVIMNCSVFGPVFPSNIKLHWLDPFLLKIYDEDAILSTPCINFLKSDNPCGPGPMAQTYFSVIKLDKNTTKLLLSTLVTNCTRNTTNPFKIRSSNFVFGPKRSHKEIIMIGEYGFSRVFLDNNYKISCLIYNNIDYTDQRLWDLYSSRSDRYVKMDNNKLKTQIFIKNNWRVSLKERDSKPCLYNKCINFCHNLFNIKDIFENIDNYNYNLLNIDKNGGDKVYQWDSKKDFYKNYGFAEEFVLWPKITKMTTSCVYYFHSSGDEIIKDYIIQSLKTLVHLGYKIFFLTYSNNIKNYSLPCNIDIVKINFKLSYNLYELILSVKNYISYSFEWFLFIDSSLIFPINGLDNMNRTINSMRQNYDSWSIYGNKNSVIDQDSKFVEFNKKSLTNIILYINKFLNIDTIKNIDGKESDHMIWLYLVNNSFKVGFVNPVCQTEDNAIILSISDKKSISISKDLLNKNILLKCNNHYLNYLTRFLIFED